MKPRFVPLYALLLVPALVFVGCGDDPQTAPDTTAPLAPVLTGATETDGLLAIWWEPNAEADLAGYHVYLIQDGSTSLINDTPMVNNFAAMEIDANGSARVYVTATDLSGNESGPSVTRKVTELDDEDGRDTGGDHPIEF
jgi:hypothetical protein